MPRKYRHRRDPLILEDQNKLANSCESMQEKLVVWTLLDTGLRVEEFCNMDKNNIDWNRHQIVVYGKNTTGEGGKKRRTVVMSNRVRPILEAWIGMNDRIGFTTRTAENIVKRVAKRAGVIKCCPHVLRHSFAVTSLEKGVPLNVLQEMLGHEDLATTAIYLKISQSEAVRIFKEKW